MRHLVAATVAGVAGGVAWIGGIVVFFLPAQALLANPAYQSAKFLSVLAEMEPLPRAAEDPWLLPAGLVLIGMVHAFVYAWIRDALGRGVWRRGLRFGIVAWALMAPWFEFYLPWNVMHEPAGLVLLELVLWLALLLLVGLAIAAVYEGIMRQAPRPR